MNNTLKEFNLYLQKIGLLENDEEFHMNLNIDEDNYESQVIKHLTDYITSSLRNMKNPSSVKYSTHKNIFSLDRIYNKFIENDDENIIKLFKRLFCIKGKANRLSKQYYFLKWYSNSKSYSKQTLENTNNYKSYSNLMDQSTNIENQTKKNFKPKYQVMSSDSSTYKFDIEKTDDINFQSNEQSNIINHNNDNSKISNKLNSKSNILYEKLYQDKALREIKYVEHIKSQNVKDLQECTFKPKINQNKQRNQVKQNSQNDPIYQKLLSFNEIKKKNINKLTVESENQLKNIYTFKPIINITKKVNDKLVNEKFDERIQRYQNQKFVNIEKIKKNIEDENKFNQENAIPKRSKTPITTRSKSLEIVKYYKQYKENKIKLLQNNIEHESGITFKPKINNNIMVNNDVIQRNQEHIKKKDEKIRQLRAYDDFECTFTPKTNIKDKNFNSLQAGNRLFEYQIMYDQKKLLLKESNNEDYSFKPHINRNTNILVERRRKNYENQQRENERLDYNEIQDIYLCDENDSKEDYSKDKYPLRPETIEEEVKEIEDDISIDKSKHNNIIRITENDDKCDTHRISNTNRLSILPLSSDPEEDFQMKEIKKLNKNNSQSQISAYGNHSNTIGDTNIERSEVKDYLKSKTKKSINTIPTGNTKQLKKGYYVIDSLSDEQLLELANHYITTDESLEKFQSKIFGKYQTKFYKEKIKNMKSKISETENKEKISPKGLLKEIKYVYKDSSAKDIKEDKTLFPVQPKNDNIKKAIKYYNQINV